MAVIYTRREQLLNEVSKMEQMCQPYRKLVEDCIIFAKQFLCLPNPINIYFEDCPSERFQTRFNAAESDDHGNLWFNKVWFTGEDRWNNHKDDIEFFVFHELRHMHQFCCINQFLNGQEFREPPEVIQKWMHGFNTYIRNVGGESQDANLAQEVEVDANAYAALLENLYHMEDGIELHFSVPEQAMDIAMARVGQYQKKPEIQRYLQTVQRKRLFEQQRKAEQKQILIRKTKIGRNDPCPCGSGLKYKKCTCKEYHS